MSRNASDVIRGAINFCRNTGHDEAYEIADKAILDLYANGFRVIRSTPADDKVRLYEPRPWYEATIIPTAEDEERAAEIIGCVDERARRRGLRRDP